MELERLKYLFRQRFAGQLTAEEEEEFYAYTYDPSNQLIVKSVIDRFLEHPPDLPLMSSEDVSAMLERIHRYPPALSDDNMESPLSRLTSRRRWSWAAAAIVAGILIAGVFYAAYNGRQPTASIAIFKPDIAPGSNKAVLTLADGSEVALDNGRDQIIQQGAVIRQQNGSLQYEAKGGGRTIGYNTVKTPRGGQFLVVLSDGTRVWLNAASQLKYPTAFSGKERIVELHGQAYFEVAPGAGRPFSIKIDKTEIKVLGTQFDIMAYGDEPVLNATLAEGAIKFVHEDNHLLLRPGQQATVDHGSGEVTVKSVEIEKIAVWRTGFFELDDNDPGTILRQLERWYDIEIIDKTTGKIEMPGGRISRELNLGDVLRILQRYGMNIKQDGRTVIISP